MMNLFRRKRQPTPGCGFLSQREMAAYLEGSLDSERQGRFKEHQRQGCAACLHLSAALEQFHTILDQGVLESERVRFGRTERIVKAVLRAQADRRQAESDRSPLGGGWELSPGELEQIAAGRQAEAVDRESSGELEGIPDAPDSDDLSRNGDD